MDQVKTNAIHAFIPSRVLADLVTRHAALRWGIDNDVRSFPADAKCMRAFYDPTTDTYVFVFEHATFPSMYEGCGGLRVPIVLAGCVE